MCGRYKAGKTPGLIALAETLDVSLDGFLFNDDCCPAAPISIIVEPEGERSVKDAIWHLYLEQTDKGLKAHKKYFSINTRYDKLNKKLEYKASRCIILATAFVESKESSSPYLLSPADGRALAFGGLYKTWVDKTTGEIVHSASMITVPGHPAPLMQNIHDKAFPLWLPYDTSVMERWLNYGVNETAEFDCLLTPRLHTDLKAVPIDKASKKNPVGDPIFIPAD
jgi:putative SOS response-associated peptidase YedK